MASPPFVDKGCPYHGALLSPLPSAALVRAESPERVQEYYRFASLSTGPEPQDA